MTKLQQVHKNEVGKGSQQAKIRLQLATNTALSSAT